MSIVFGAIAFAIVFLMLRRFGGITRHILAFIVGSFLSVFAAGFYAAAILPIGPSTERMVYLWAPMLGMIFVGLIAGILLAMRTRRRRTT